MGRNISGQNIVLFIEMYRLCSVLVIEIRLYGGAGGGIGDPPWSGTSSSSGSQVRSRRGALAGEMITNSPWNDAGCLSESRCLTC